MKRFLLPGVAALAVALAGAAAAENAAVVVLKPPAAKLPVSAFFEHPAFSDAGLAPDGRSVAMRYAPKGSRVRLAVMDVKTHKIDVIAALSDADIVSFNWVNDNRLVFSVGDRTIGQGDMRMGLACLRSTVTAANCASSSAARNSRTSRTRTCCRRRPASLP